MFNTIKMELYRMIKSKSTYVILLITFAFSIMMVGITKLSIDGTEEIRNMITEEENMAMDDIAMGISFSASDLLNKAITLENITVIYLNSGFILLLLVIFVSIFSCGENSSGFIKNVINKRNYRSQMVISKTVVAAAFTFVEFIIAIVTTLISIKVFFGTAEIGSISSLLSHLSIQYIMHLTIAVLVVAFCLISRSLAFSMSMGIILSVNLFATVLSLLDKLKLGFKVADYSVVTGIMTISPESESSYFIRLIIVSIVYFILYHGVCLFATKKQDVK